MVGLQEKNNALSPLFDAVLAQKEPLDGYAMQHWQQAASLGLPTPRDEDWKYTDLDGFKRLVYSDKQREPLTTEQVEQYRLPVDAYLLVFVDGEYQPTLSDSDIGLFRVSVLDVATKENLPNAINPEIFLHLTEAFNHSGVCISLDENAREDRPLYLLHITRQGAGGMAQIRNHLSVSPNSKACVIEHFVSFADLSCVDQAECQDTSHYVGARLSMSVGDNSQLEHYNLCCETHNNFHFSHNDINIGRDAKVSSQSFLLSGHLTRHHTSCALNGENSELVINSLCLPSHHQIYDSRTYLEHNKGHCTSEQLHKMIVQDNASAVFNGMIKVAPNALKTNGQMDNHNLLLSDAGEINSKPQLEIYADDVKCSHGTTTGALSQEQVFYLQARGISKCQAEQMITFAFAAEVTEAINIPAIKELIFNSITEKLSGER